MTFSTAGVHTPASRAIFGFYAFFHQSVKAEFRECHRCLGCFSTGAGSSSASLAGSCFKIGGKCITHSGYGQADWRFYV